MSPEEFMQAVQASNAGVAVVPPGDIQAYARMVLTSKFVSYFTSRDRLSRRYSRELPIFQLWGAIFLHSSWLNGGRVYPVHFAILSSMTGLTLPTVSRAVSLAVAQGDVVKEAFEGDFRRRTIDPTERLYLYRLEKTAALVGLWSEVTGRPDPWGQMTDALRRDVMSVQCYFVRRTVISQSSSPVDRNQFLTLLTLASRGPTSQELFVEQQSGTIGMTRMGMVLLLERLAARGLIERTASGSIAISCVTQQFMGAILGAFHRRFNTFLDLANDAALLSGVAELVRREVTSLGVDAKES